MINHATKIDKTLHIIYNNDGESFEKLFAEGIRQANIKALQKRIISNATPDKKEPSK